MTKIKDYDFTVTCDTHDLGYEILRFWNTGGSMRRYVDSLRTMIYGAVALNSWLSGYGRP